MTRPVVLLVRAVFAREEAVDDAAAELAGAGHGSTRRDRRRWLGMLTAGTVGGLLLGSPAAVIARFVLPGSAGLHIDAGLAGAFIGICAATYLWARVGDHRPLADPEERFSMIVATSTADLDSALVVIERFGGAAVEVLTLADEEGASG